MGTTVLPAGDGGATPALSAYLNLVFEGGVLPPCALLTPTICIFVLCRVIFPEFQNTKLQPGQSRPRCGGTRGKLENGRKNTPRVKLLPGASHRSPRLSLGGIRSQPHCTPCPASPHPGALGGGCHGEHQHGTGSTGTALGAPARHGKNRHGIHDHHAPGEEGRAAGRKWGLPASAKYRKESDASSALWSCREHELKVRPRSQLRSGVAGAERELLRFRLANPPPPPGNSSHRSSFAPPTFFTTHVYARPGHGRPRWRRAAHADERRRLLWRRSSLRQPARRTFPLAFGAFTCERRRRNHRPGGLARHSAALCVSPTRIFWIIFF